jgi:hypothetical protein
VRINHFYVLQDLDDILLSSSIAIRCEMGTSFLQ